MILGTLGFLVRQDSSGSKMLSLDAKKHDLED